MMNVCAIYLRLDVENFHTEYSKIFEAVLNLTGFEPEKMSFGYHEFYLPKDMKYDKTKALESYTKSEMDTGYTSITLRCKKDRKKELQPFISFGITLGLINDMVSTRIGLTISFRYFDSYEMLFDNHNILRNVLNKNVSLITSYYYNEEERLGISDYEEMDDRNPLKWSKFKEAVFVAVLRAAPVMYFGNEIYPIIPRKELLKIDGARPIEINNHEIIEIKLFDFADKPGENWEKQKHFWTKLYLENRLDDFKQTLIKKKNMTATEYLQYRSDLWTKTKKEMKKKNKK